jgi:hypothetical protein
MSDQIQINVSIDSILERRFSIAESSIIPSGDLAKQMKVNHLIDTEIDTSNHKLTVDAGVKYSLEEQTLCELIISVVFLLEPFDSLIRIDSNQRTISFSAEFMPTLLNVAYGTLRGVLHEKTKGSPLAAFPLQMAQIEELTKMNRFRVR